MEKLLEESESLGALNQYARDIDRCQPLSREEEVALARRARHGDENARWALIRANVRFVVSVAGDYVGRGVSLIELISEGNMGLIKAADLFDERLGCKFITYAVWWIRQAIFKALDRAGKDIKPQGHRVNDLRILRREGRLLGQELGHEPTPGDLAAYLGWKRQRVEIALALGSSHVSLDEPIGLHDKDREDLIKILPDSNVDLESEFNERELGDTLRHALTILDEREQYIIEHHFGLDGRGRMNMKKIGRTMGLSRERVRQIRNKALEKMRGDCGEMLVELSHN